jgi:hypothetical protein
LGVYASAVHARWVGADNRVSVRALAIASEPYIFWRGDSVETIVHNIAIPRELGALIPADRQHNGPSGVALDELILKPLGLVRSDAWLCDLVPHSCVNPAQSKAIERAYLPVADTYGLPEPTVPPVPKAFSDEKRRRAILDELRESGADVLILLGDQPIRWFLAYFEPRWKQLKDFLLDGQPYGTLFSARIDGVPMTVLPVAHPRQIAQLGTSSRDWYDRHRVWVHERAGMIFR